MELLGLYRFRGGKDGTSEGPFLFPPSTPRGAFCLLRAYPLSYRLRHPPPAFTRGLLSSPSQAGSRAPAVDAALHFWRKEVELI